MIDQMPPRQLLRNALWIGFGLRLTIAVWNGFFGPSVGATGDAPGFHELAAGVAEGAFPERFRIGMTYIYGLGAYYWLVGASVFMGSLLSCLVWLLSAWLLVASFGQLNVGVARAARAVMLYGVLPSSVMWTSITMREPYQLLCVNLSIYAALRILRGAWWYWLWLAAAIGVGVLLHAVLLGWGVCLMTALVAAQVYNKVGHSPIKLTVALVGALALAYFGVVLFGQLYSFPIDRGLAFAVNSYQQGGLQIGVRTDYRSDVDILTTIDLLMFLPIALMQYLFEPMPWRATSVVDLVPVAENLLRFGLIAQVLTLVLTLPAAARGRVLLVFGSYLVLEMAWAVGTFNWGTAARHHIPADGLLLLAAFADPRPVRSVSAFQGTPTHASA